MKFPYLFQYGRNLEQPASMNSSWEFEFRNTWTNDDEIKSAQVNLSLPSYSLVSKECTQPKLL